MKLVLDTSVLIDVLRGNQAAVAFLEEAASEGDELWSVTVVRTEVLAGMRPKEEAATLGLLDAIRWVEVTVELADAAGVLARAYLRSHPGVDVADYLVAAAAEQLDARVCTMNVSHFPMIQGIEPPYR